MDIPVKHSRRSGLLKKIPVLAGIGLLMVFGLYQVSTAFNGVEQVSLSDLVTARVTEGELVRVVRATGTLQPAELRWLDSRVSGRVEAILLEAGQVVTTDTLILEMSNPTLRRNVDTARIEMDVLEAETRVLEKRLNRDRLAQEAVVADVSAQYENARFRKEANQSLAEKGIVPEIDLNESLQQEQSLKIRVAIERERLVQLQELNEAEMLANQARINRARTQFALQQELLDDLKVRAGINGILQEVPVEVGQQINEGTLLARVAREDNLQAELRVQESQAGEVTLGQPVVISTNGKSVTGTVRRIDPAVQNGVVRVDVVFDARSLPGARPDLRIDGAIEIHAVANTLKVARPVFSREHATAGLFVLNTARDEARRVPVSLGMGSVDAIQVIEGLKVGDEIIVSDTNAFADRDILSLVN